MAAKSCLGISILELPRSRLFRVRIIRSAFLTGSGSSAESGLLQRDGS